MDNKQVNKAPQKSARLVLQAVTAIARSNANSLCRGLLYEPKSTNAVKKIRLGGIDYDVKSLKQKIAKVGIGLFCAGCVFLSSAAYSQAASYTAYALKLNKTNNFTSMHAKKQHPMITSQMR